MEIEKEREKEDYEKKRSHFLDARALRVCEIVKDVLCPYADADTTQN